jgi:hypothetical protein
MSREPVTAVLRLRIADVAATSREPVTAVLRLRLGDEIDCRSRSAVGVERLRESVLVELRCHNLDLVGIWRRQFVRFLCNGESGC